MNLENRERHFFLLSFYFLSSSSSFSHLPCLSLHLSLSSTNTLSKSFLSLLNHFTLWLQLGYPRSPVGKPPGLSSSGRWKLSNEPQAGLLGLWLRAQFWHPRDSVVSFPQPHILNTVSKKSCCLFKDIFHYRKNVQSPFYWLFPHSPQNIFP